MKRFYFYTSGTSESEVAGLKDGWSVRVLGGTSSQSPLREPLGENQAVAVGKRISYLIRKGSIDPTLQFRASAEERAQQTLNIALGEVGLRNVMVVCSPSLNERNYGELSSWPVYRWTLGNSGMLQGSLPRPTPMKMAEAGVEGVGAVTARMKRSLGGTALITPEGGTCVIVSHPEAISILAKGIAGAGVAVPFFNPHATETLIIDDGGRWSVEYAHLSVEKKQDPEIRHALWVPSDAGSAVTE